MASRSAAGASRRLLPLQPVLDADSVPLSDLVREALCCAIFDGTLPAGYQLIQDNVASDLGVSRTPVREALIRLAREGYVRRVPGRGYVVGSINASDVDDVYQIRQAIEPLALLLAFDHMRPRDLSLLRRLDAEMHSPAWNSVGYFESNRRFHLALIDRCPNRLLVRIIEQVWELPVMRLMSRDFVEKFRDARAWRDDHGGIVAAIENDDKELAVHLLEDHLKANLVSAQSARAHTTAIT
jgi:DNA-binding GntR family transcriptional regulator